mgnify:CR=1 FL=1
MYLLDEESKALRENKACGFKIPLYTRVGRRKQTYLRVYIDKSYVGRFSNKGSTSGQI